MIKSLTIFSGNAHRDLAEAICRCVEVRPGAAEVTRFSDGEVYVELGENVRGVNCFVVQPTCSPVNESLMELLIMIDALKRASAGSIVAAMPYFGYARQDRKVKPRSPISAKLVADLMNIIGDVKGKDAIIVDDMIDTAGTLAQAAKAIMDAGARSVTACASHGVLSGPAVARIEAAPLAEVIVTDTIPLRPEAKA